MATLGAWPTWAGVRSTRGEPVCCSRRESQGWAWRPAGYARRRRSAVKIEKHAIAVGATVNLAIGARFGALFVGATVVATLTEANGLGAIWADDLLQVKGQVITHATDMVPGGATALGVQAE